MKRFLYLLHRWLGVPLALFMAMWFVSGVVMMYVGYPRLSEAERLAASPPLDAAHCCAGWAELRAAAGSAPRSARLSAITGEPRVVFTLAGRQARSVDAMTAQAIAPVTEQSALAAARAFLPGAAARHEAVIDEDAWTHSRALDAHRPLHRIRMDDAARTVLYVSGSTGEVVRDASGTERAWGWVGTWIHWLYPFRGGALDAHWRDIVIYGSIAATLLTLAGVLVGIWRWRFRGRYRSGARTPYREGWMRWHHVGGMVFGLTSAAFIFSGLMSMNPFRSMESAAPRLEQRLTNAGGDLAAAQFELDAGAALRRLADAGFVAHELEWRNVLGRAHYLARDARGNSRLLAADVPAAQPVEALDVTTLSGWGRALLPEARMTEAALLTGPDLYYYLREPHTMTGGSKPALPVLRLKFDDERATWLHLDPRSGAVINQMDARRRLNRWLFAFLHSWDWPVLLALRPLWDAWMIALSAGGLLVSLTGVVIGARRLARKLGQRPAAVASRRQAQGT